MTELMSPTVLEVHDSTGFAEQAGATPITDAVDYWTSSEISSVLQGEEDFIIINIANEPYGNSASMSQYVDGTKNAIQAMRTAGFTHTLMVDAANWGQDWQFFMRDNAPEIFAADSQANTIFDVHMYEVFRNASTQQAYIEAFQAHNLALVIGEFGPVHNGQAIDAQSILSLSQQFGVGYLGWSWSGNGSCCVDLDIVNNFNANSLTTWGELLINGAISDAASPSHSYASAGDYIVSLTVSDGELSDSVTKTITVQVSNSGGGDTGGGDTGGGNNSGGTANCEYVIQNSWNSGFVAEVRITNNGTQAISGWDVAWSMPSGSSIVSSWNANVTGSGPYQANNLGWNADIAPGQTVSFGLQGSHNGSTSAPTVSGSVCN